MAIFWLVWLRCVVPSQSWLQAGTLEISFTQGQAPPRPGVDVLWHGLQKLDVAIDMYHIYRPNERCAMRSECSPWHSHPDEDGEDSG